MTTRDRWVSQQSEGGVFERTGTGWQQYVPGHTFTFIQTAVNDDYIELVDGGRSLTVRLFNGEAQMQWPNHPMSHEYNGAWSPPRNRWVSQQSEGGVFERTGTGWQQYVPGHTFTFIQTAVNEKYIELVDGSRSLTAQLFDNEAQMQWPNHPMAHEYNGAWSWS